MISAVPSRPYNFTEGSRPKCGSSDQDIYRIFMTGLGRYADAFVRRQHQAG